MLLPDEPRRGRAPLAALLLLAALLAAALVWLLQGEAGRGASLAAPGDVAALASGPTALAGETPLAPAAGPPTRPTSALPDGVRLRGVGRLEGLVRERATGATVPGVSVRLLSLPPATATILARITEMTGTGGAMRRKVEPLAVTTSDAAGRFAFEGVRAGRWYLDVAADHHVAETAATARVVESGSGGPVTVWTRAGGRVVGDVLRPDGAPARGALVMLTTGAMGFLDAAQRGEVSLLELTADAEGRFAFPAVPPAKGYELSAVGEGFAVTHRMGIDVRAGEDTEVTLRTRPGATLTGRVLSRPPAGQGPDDEGAPSAVPLADARVGAVPRGLRHLRFVKQILEHTHGVTDEAGRYVLRNVPAGAVDVLAIAADHVPGKAPVVRVGAGATHVVDDLVLARGPEVRGRVVDSDGRGIAGVRVMFNVVDFRGLEGDVSFAPLMVAGMREFEYPETDAEGRFVAGAIAGRAPFDLRFLRHGYKELGRKWDPAVHGYEIEVVLERGGAVEGIVMDLAEATPVTAFTISTRQRVERTADDPSRWNPFAGGREFEAPDGRFTLDSLEPGEVRLVVSAPGYLDAPVSASVAEGETTRLRPVKMRHGATLAGRVVDAAGAPVAGAQVTTDGRVRTTFDRLEGNRRDAERSFGVPDDFRPRMRGRQPTPPLGFLRYFASLGLMVDGVALTDSDGAFVLEGLEPGAQEVLAFHREYRAAVAGPFELELGERRDGVVVTLDEGGTLFGTVSDRHGRPVTDATVIAASPGMFEPGTSKGGLHQSGTDGTGAFELRNLDGGGYFLIVTRGDEALSPMSFLGTLNLGMVSVPSSGRQRHDIVDTSAGGCRLHGVVRSEGEPVGRGVLVAFNFEAEGLLGVDVKIANVEAGGAYEFEGLAPGEYQVSYEGPGPTTRFLLEVPDAPELRRDIDLPSARVAGRVVDAVTGAPVAGAEVRLEPRARVTPEGLLGQLLAGEARVERVRTDADGAYAFRRLAGGDYRILASGPRRGELRGRFSAADPQEVELADGERLEGLDLELPAALALEGLVVDDMDVPVPEATVVATRAGDAFARAETARTDAAGRFELGGLGPGVWDVTARAPGFAPGAAPGVELDGAGALAPLELRLERGLEVTVRVTDAGGAPVEGAVAALVAVDAPAPGASDPGRFFENFFRGEATTNAEGELALGTFASGPHELTVRRGLVQRKQVVELPPGGGATVLRATL